MTDWILTQGVQTAIAVSALILLVLVTRKAVSRQFGPRWAYALWALPILRLFLPGLVIPVDWLPAFIKPVDTTPLPPVEITPIMLSELLAADSTPLSGPTWTDSIPVMALSLWVAGIGIGALWLLWQQYRHRAHVSHITRPPCESLKHRAQQLTRQMGLKRVPDIKIMVDNATDEGPLVMGLVRPIIILPARFEQDLTEDQQRLALLHELMHIRRGDLWAASAMMGFRLLNWPNPLIHWAWPRFRADQEAACDASVLRLTGDTSRGDYAETLLKAAQAFTQAPQNRRASLTAGMGLSLSLHHPIKERLMILGSKKDQHSSASRWALGAMLMAGAALCAPISLAGDPGDKTEIKETSVIKIVTSDGEDSETKGFEVRSENGVTTYLRHKPDGTTEEITAEEMESVFGVDVTEFKGDTAMFSVSPMEGEPGIAALLGNGDSPQLRTMIMKSAENKDLDIEFEDGKMLIFKTDEDGNRIEVEKLSIDSMKDGSFPFSTGNGNIQIFSDESRVVELLSKGEGAQSFRFEYGGDGSFGSANARLRSTQSMLEATERMIADLKADADSSAQKDLRDAERQLGKARKALEKAQASVEKADTP